MVNKWNKNIIALSSFSIICILGVFLFVKNDSKPLEIEQTSNKEKAQINLNDGFKLGVIGDSWVVDKKIDPSIASSLEGNGFDVSVQSYSLPGRKSGEIYEDMITENSISNSNRIIKNKEVDAILVVAGVNDTAGHIGADYYSKSIKNIISYANKNGKFVYILEVPEYGIEEKESLLSSIKHNVYKIINDNGKTDVIADYRSELRTRLDQSGLEGFSIITYPEEIDDYNTNTDLYENQFHLNEDGSNILGGEIGGQILKSLPNHTVNQLK